MSKCEHVNLRLEPSEHARTVGYEAPTLEQLSAATHPSGKVTKAKKSPDHDLATFPAPLVLPRDELSWDPEYEPQSMKDWIEELDRNEVTKARRTIYLVPTPKIAKNMGHVRDWTVPDTSTEHAKSKPSPSSPVKVEDILAYLQAFYHGLPVKLLAKPTLGFVPWSTTKKPKSERVRIGLKIGSRIIGIRHRPSPDNLFSGQLNLEDLLDAAIELLPRDAYAILLLVDHDLYESEEDDFCCGRAYGGSRVAVVSTARYNPSLDTLQEVEREHAWPASHCQDYVDGCCRGREPPRKKTKKVKDLKTPSAMRSAINASTNLPSPSPSNLWLGRISKTASHELGHCFGMDHCVYRACIMQGTAGLSEDARQPPYLCPVDLAKVLHATNTTASEQYEHLLEFCGKRPDDRLFAAFAAWLKARLGR